MTATSYLLNVYFILHLVKTLPLQLFSYFLNSHITDIKIRLA